MISTRSAALLIDTVVCLTLAKWETVSGQFGGYLRVIDEGRDIIIVVVVIVSEDLTRRVDRGRDRALGRPGHVDGNEDAARQDIAVLSAADVVAEIPDNLARSVDAECACAGGARTIDG